MTSFQAALPGKPDQMSPIRAAVPPDVAASVDTVDHAIGYGAHQYGYNGWGMAAVMPYAKWVSLTLMQGSFTNCGDACPFFPGKRYEDWKLDDPAGQGIDAVRPIRDDIRSRIEGLIASLAG